MLNVGAEAGGKKAKSNAKIVVVQGLFTGNGGRNCSLVKKPLSGMFFP